MKNKLQLIDVNIVSAYMGRFQTGIVALLVLGITAHALVTRGSARGHVTMVLAAPAGDEVDGGVCETFARLVARRTSRSVVVASGRWDDASELYLMPTVEFMERREELGLRALFGVGTVAWDHAVIVAREKANGVPRDAGEVLVESPWSLNACWVQLRALASERVPVPRSADSLRCAPGHGAERVIMAVLAGTERYGACRRSDLDRMTRRGTLRPDDLDVVLEAPALPELIVAAREADARYVVDCLGGLGAVFEDPQTSPRDRDTVELLRERGMGSFRPVSGSQLAAIESVFEFMTARGAASPPR